MTEDNRQALAGIAERAFGWLETGGTEAERTALQAEFDALALDEDALEAPAALEARVLLRLCTDQPAQRAGKMLYALFRARMAEQQFGRFETFQTRLAGLAKVSDPEAGLRLVSYFGNVDHDRVWQAVGDVLRQVERLIGPTFLNSGTLLGVVRERGLLKHDDDVDLAVMLDGGTVEEAAASWIRAYHALHKAGLLQKEAKRNRAVFKLVALDELNVDLFPGWVERGRVHVYPHSFGTLSAQDVLPLAVCPHSGLPIPRDPARMLASNYGEGWRQPDPGYSFNWRRANRKFRAFHDALEADLSMWKL